MRNPSDLLKQSLVKKTDLPSSDDFEIIDVIPIPMHGDPMVRLRTLEEALNDLDQSTDTRQRGAIGYFVQIVPKAKGADHSIPVIEPTPVSEDIPPPKSTSEGIYLSNGKLNLPVLLDSAEMLYRSGDYTLARNIYKAIASSGERTSVALLGLGRCYEAEQRFEEAKINYEESIAYHPQIETYKALIALLIQQKKDQQAAETIERALHHRFDEAARYDLHRTAGNCWGRLGNLHEAERHYKKALELQPNGDEIRVNLGMLHLQNNRMAEADRHFNDALAANPKSHQALMGLGSCALADGNPTAAHAWFARSLQIEIRNPTAIFHLVKCAYSIKRYDIAARVLENYVQVAPVNLHLLYSLAGLQFHLGRLSEAQATCLKIQQLNPDHAGARDLIHRIEGINLGGL